ncbi:MAG: hypothetical protein Q9P14_01360 [candidate division KSB1 bacterium]|nr:hypothetical protein [candidate division KSB1 bacterium]
MDGMQDLPEASNSAGDLQEQNLQKNGGLKINLDPGPEMIDESGDDRTEATPAAGALASDLDPDFSRGNIGEHSSVLEDSEPPRAAAPPAAPLSEAMEPSSQNTSETTYSQASEPPLPKEPDSSIEEPAPDRLENPFDIAEIDDPWLGGMELEQDDSTLRSRLSDAMIEEVDLNVPDFQQEFRGLDHGPSANSGESGHSGNWEATEEDYENLQWLKKDAVSLFEAAENGNSHHTSRLPDHPGGNSRLRMDDDPLLEKIVSVVIANPSYGPSVIRKVLLDMNLIDPSVTRSMIFKKLIQLGLTTRAKREAFAKNHSLD